ncbi:hypothetical protein RIF29_08265 [Crotalaria pallida]|uniref:Uncharacterized protein n=1 Tax=Crotalaria pallida TaxID=3830 RepID=A0AAN9J649_CROPI
MFHFADVAFYLDFQLWRVGPARLTWHFDFRRAWRTETKACNAVMSTCYSHAGTGTSEVFKHVFQFLSNVPPIFHPLHIYRNVTHTYKSASATKGWRRATEGEDQGLLTPVASFRVYPKQGMPPKQTNKHQKQKTE